MKRTALIVAALMVGGSALAQTGSTSDPYDTTPDTAVSADTTVNTDIDATTDTTVDADMDGLADTTATGQIDTTATMDTTASTTTTGMGGPFVAATEVTSKGGYPPCDPGPGDDMCIQLYESGVSSSTNLAMNRNLADGSTMMANAGSNWNNEVGASTAATGVGGPYEPVTSDTGQPHDGQIVREEGPTEASDVAGTDYPACDPGAGDDNCIQLYERGVMDDVQ